MIYGYERIGYTLLGATILFASCIVKQYQKPVIAANGKLYRDTAIVATSSTDTSAVDTASIADLPYTQLFTDTVLQSLITEGIRQNYNLKTAIQRINEAQANLLQSKAAFLPSVDGIANVSKNRQSIAAINLPPDLIGTYPLTTTSYQVGINTSWEADIWGKLRSAKRVALANLLETDAAKRAVETELVANIATDYYQLLSLDRQLEITEQTLENRKKDVETVKALKEGAVVTGAAVVQSEANQYATEVLIPDLKRDIRSTENALSILLARSPGAINRSSLAKQTNYTNLQTGIASSLLKNRPDVQQAEFTFRAAFENTNLARTYFYPQLTLTAQAGASSLGIKDLFSRSVFYNIVAGLTQPVFNKGQNKARLHIAQAQQEEAFYAFQQSLLNAGAQVSDALYSYQTAMEKQQSRTNQLLALEKAVDYTKELLSYSSATNYTDVLTSEQALLSAQLSSVNDRLQQLQAVVNLYRALGGGWK